jgi:phosphoglycerate dehydrogenase-like enzyme
VRIALLDDYQNIALSMADWGSLPAGNEVRAFKDHIFDEDALARRLAGFDAVVAMRERTPFSRSLVEKLPDLKLLITTGMRNASFDMEALKDHGVLVCGTGLGGPTTAELTWGLIIGIMRHIGEEDRAAREGRWQEAIGPGLPGKVLGVVGLGNLGSRVAAVGKLFGMEVIAWSQNLTAERAEAGGARLVAKDELLSQADVVTIHLQLSDRTRGIIGARELALMKPDAYLINTSRGPIVDEQALIETLRQRRIAGAALDVFDVEPLPVEHPFLHLPNTLITPHIGYVTSDGYRVAYANALENIKAFIAGSPMRVVER